MRTAFQYTLSPKRDKVICLDLAISRIRGIALYLEAPERIVTLPVTVLFRSVTLVFARVNSLWENCY
jgi:hypothetical protein